MGGRTEGEYMQKQLQLTAIIEREGKGNVASCPAVDVVSQGNTIEQARLNLLEAVEGFFEAASPSEIRRRLKKQTFIMPLMPSIKMKQVTRLRHA
jgi:predicted RNase H-like HicB family nuclease